MVIIGLTGNLGAGKTTIAKMFAKFGAKILDADTIARQMLDPDGVCFKPVVRWLGKEILDRGTIDRHKLAGIVFADPKKLQKLNAIIHPPVIKTIKEEIRKAKATGRPAVVEAALLIESGLNELVDVVILVRANRALQIKRVMNRTNMTRSKAVQRLTHQMSVKEKIKYADIIIDNRRSLTQTKKQVEEIWQKLQQRKRNHAK